MSKAPAYRGLRRTASRDALLGAAEELIGSKGFHETSVDDIVARAGVAKGTFYNHFSDKRDIAHHLALTIRREVRDRIGVVKRRSADPAMHLAIAQTLFMDLAARSPHRAHILATMLAGVTDTGVSMNERVRMTLVTGRKTGRFAFGSIDGALVYVVGIVLAGMQRILEKRGSAPPRALVAELIAQTLIGLGLARSEAPRIAALAVSEFFDIAER